MQSERPKRLNERTVDYGLAVMEFCETLPHTGAKIERLPSDSFQGKGDRWVIDFNAEAQSGRVAQNSGDENLNVANVKMLPIANWGTGNGKRVMDTTLVLATLAQWQH